MSLTGSRLHNLYTIMLLSGVFKNSVQCLRYLFKEKNFTRWNSLDMIVWKMQLLLLFICIVLQILNILSMSLMLTMIKCLLALLAVKMYKPRYFVEKEFTRCSPPCKLSDLDEAFLYKLDEARDLCDFPFIVNSAYRSKAYELSKGRNGTSSHCKGLAMDIACSSSHVREAILSALIRVGFRRIGIYPTFIHVDMDEDKLSAIWLDDSFVCGG